MQDNTLPIQNVYELNNDNETYNANAHNGCTVYQKPNETNKPNEPKTNMKKANYSKLKKFNMKKKIETKHIQVRIVLIHIFFTTRKTVFPFDIPQIFHI